jgi:hypothetical protein
MTKVIDMLKDEIRDPHFRYGIGSTGRLGRTGTMGTWKGKQGRLGITLPPNGFTKDIEACGIAGLINVDGTRESGSRVVDMITTMQDRENGLGAGFACYGLFMHSITAYSCFWMTTRPETGWANISRKPAIS